MQHADCSHTPQKDSTSQSHEEIEKKSTDKKKKKKKNFETVQNKNLRQAFLVYMQSNGVKIPHLACSPFSPHHKETRNERQAAQRVQHQLPSLSETAHCMSSMR